MNKKTQHQQGFALVEGLLVLIVLLLVGFIAYYVYTVNNKTSDVYDTATASTTQPAATKKTSSANEVAAIKKAVLAYKDNTGLTGAVVTVDHNNDSYALGGVTDKSGNGSAQWFAQKVNGSWTVVSQGMDGHCDELATHNLSSWDTACTEAEAQ